MNIDTAPTTAMTDAEINWLAQEVLPAIRRTGSFAAPQSPAPTPEVDPDAVARMIIAMTMEKLAPIEQALNELAERIGVAVPVLVGANTLIHSLQQDGEGSVR